MIKTESAAFSEYMSFPEGIPAIRNAHARAFLKMVWFLDTKGKLLWAGTLYCNLGVCVCGYLGRLRWGAKCPACIPFIRRLGKYIQFR